MPTELLLRVDWTHIYPDFRDLCFTLVANCQARGARYFATSGFRSPEDQEALWSIGRNEDGAVIDPKAIVTKLRFGYHNLGIAIDFTRDISDKKGLQPSHAPADYEILAEEAEKLGLESGHRWKTLPDSYHVQLKLSSKNISLSMLKGRYEQTGKVSSAWHLLDENAPWEK